MREVDQSSGKTTGSLYSSSIATRRGVLAQRGCIKKPVVFFTKTTGPWSFRRSQPRPGCTGSGRPSQLRLPSGKSPTTRPSAFSATIVSMDCGSRENFALGKAPSPRTRPPMRAFRKSCSLAMNCTGRLTPRAITTGSNVAVWLPKSVTAPSWGKGATKRLRWRMTSLSQNPKNRAKAHSQRSTGGGGLVGVSLRGGSIP
jgi:hypothetical protein